MSKNYDQSTAGTMQINMLTVMASRVTIKKGGLVQNCFLQGWAILNARTDIIYKLFVNTKVALAYTPSKANEFKLSM
jgi:hypothetical protein